MACRHGNMPRMINHQFPMDKLKEFPARILQIMSIKRESPYRYILNVNGVGVGWGWGWGRARYIDIVESAFGAAACNMNTHTRSFSGKYSNSRSSDLSDTETYSIIHNECKNISILSFTYLLHVYLELALLRVDHVEMC